MTHFGLDKNLDNDNSSLPPYDDDNSINESVQFPSLVKHDKVVNSKDFQINLVNIEARFQALRKETRDKLRSLEQEVKLNKQVKNSLYCYPVGNGTYNDEIQRNPVKISSEPVMENGKTNQEIALIFLCIWGFYGMVILLSR